MGLHRRVKSQPWVTVAGVHLRRRPVLGVGVFVHIALAVLLTFVPDDSNRPVEGWKALASTLSRDCEKDATHDRERGRRHPR